MADITMPQLGETVTEGTITRWYKQVGDTVKADEVLFEVSTDKVDSEVPSPASGVVTVLARVGDSAGAPAPTPAAAPPEPAAAPPEQQAPAPPEPEPEPIPAEPEAPAAAEIIPVPEYEAVPP